MIPLRLALGAVFLVHGGQKLFGWMGGGGIKGTGVFFSDKGLDPGLLYAWLAGGGEFLGGLLILIGFLTRFGALLTGVCMVMAILLVHRDAFLLKESGMEYVVTLLAGSLTLLIAGGGALSIDRMLGKKKEK